MEKDAHALARFETAIPTSDRPHPCALDRAATGIDLKKKLLEFY